MTRLSSLNSGAFRFALLIAGMFALGSMVLLGVVEHSIRAYAAEATVVGLRSEMAMLTEDWPDGGRAELVDAIEHRQRASYEEPFPIPAGRPARSPCRGPPADRGAAHPGWGKVAFVDDTAVESDQAVPEMLQTLGTRLSDGSTLVVATDTFDVQTLRRRLAAYTVWSSIGVTLLALVGGYLIGILFLRRLGRVNDAVARIMSGDLSERLPGIGMSPEFDHLSRNLNAMLDRIAALMEGLRQVSTNIAHDLRTPLTRLQQRLEAIRDSGSTAAYEAGIESALAQIEQIHAIFRALLRIGLLEASERGRALGPVDLSELVGRVAAAYSPAAEDGGRPLMVTVAQGVSVAGDPELLGQLITNLIDNALVHTPIGTAIEASLIVVGGQPRVVIADEGPGVPADQRGRILERFYRLDTSRHTPGAGLGLALVTAIAALHGAELVIEDNGPGLRVELRFQG